MHKELQLFRASILHFPIVTEAPEHDYVFYSDGLLVTRNDKIIALGPYSTTIEGFSNEQVVDYTGKLIVPGFIDSHLHFPQTEMIASFGEQLLQWLENYTFPTEKKFSAPQYASEMADVFIEQLYANGTTTAAVFSSVHQQATDALFEAAYKQKMCLIAGKVCMDRHCPEDLQDTAEIAYQETKGLIEKWHSNDRLLYAITPRFAPTSSEQQLVKMGKLVERYPSVYIQTHLSENHQEINWVNELFPDCSDYLSVYEKFGLVNERSIFGHCLHLNDREWQRLSDLNATIAFCPSSNLFLGSGLFDLDKAKKYGVGVALASDVGAGTSFNMLRTMGDAYKSCQLKGIALSPLEGLYMMSQGSAHQLKLTDTIGNLNIGTHGDFVVLDPAFNKLSQLRTASAYNREVIELPQDII
ncbi:guanine deaminase, partial [Aliiglaciecola sp.]|nr:guanine deaminase [Aliiglaciecola sp.]